ncbi:Cu(I)-responsive transcriptional regulator [Pigmentiphaga soli]|uniref:Cu(I)-responsive transcriptional regulator n=1 Tax=Pigmentiphaga soli TaxID=1007095 RepID=A0ABP8GI28_9BURK
MKTFNIGQAAAASGVSAKMIRHYESIGLIRPARRTEAGYRLYGDTDVHTLRFIRNARDLGFSIAQIDTLLRLWADRGRPSADVKQVALAHIRDLDDKIRGLQAMKTTLEDLADRCHGDHRPDCPILAGLAGAAPGADAPECEHCG